MSEMADIIFCVFLYLFQGYCLQYFCGSFLESRIRDRRWNALAVMVSYAVSRRVLFQFQIGSEKNWDHRVGVGKMALALCVMSVLVLCFYRALHLITIFLVVAFQAIADISRYTTVILVGELGDGLLSLWNWCAGRGLLTSEKAFSSAVNTGILWQWILEYLAMALILYLSLKKIVGESANIGPEHVSLIARAGGWYAFSAHRVSKALFGLLKKKSEALRIVDELGVIRLQKEGAGVLSVPKGKLGARLSAFIDDMTSYNDGGAMLPRCYLYFRQKAVDLSGVMEKDQLLPLLELELEFVEDDEPLLLVAVRS